MNERGRAHPAEMPTVTLKLWPVPHQGVMTVRFLGEIQGMLTHYVFGRPKGRSVACKGEECEKTVHKLRTIWKGYAPIEIARMQQRDWYPGVLEITSALGQELAGRKLAGEIWALERRIGDFKHPEETGVFIRVERPAPIDARQWVETVCFRLYGVKEIQWGAKDPLPSRVRLQTRPLSSAEEPQNNPTSLKENPAVEPSKPLPKMGQLYRQLLTSTPQPTSPGESSTQ